MAPLASTSGSAQVASPTALDIPTPSSSSSRTPAPLSPDIVASLQLDLSWLDLRLPPAVPGASSSSAASSSSSSSAGTPPRSAAMLAQRRMHRPPLFRRRSTSLDDADAEEADGVMETLLDEREREVREARERDETARAVVRIDPSATAAGRTRESSAGGLAPPPLSARSATTSLAESQATSMPNSVTSSSLSTLAGSEAAGAAPALGKPSSSAGSAVEDRLVSWVRSTSQDGLSGSAPLATPSTAAKSIRLPLPPRQPYTPVLPSPLSTCSYTSQDDEADRESGFPFPPTPHQTDFTPATTDGSRPHSERSSPIAALKDLPPLSTVPPAGLSPRRAALPARPAFQSFASGSTISSATTATVAGTPFAQPDLPSSSRAQDPRVSPTFSRSATEPLPPVASTSTSTSSSASPAPGSASSPAPLAAVRARSHTRGTSASSLSFTPSPSSLARSSLGAPLTPPESLTAGGPWQAGASAAEQAWHEVLSAKFGAAAGAPHGSDSSAGSGGKFGLPPAAVAALGAIGARAKAEPGTGTGTGSWGGGGPSTGTTGGLATGGAGGGAGAGGDGAKKAGWQGNELMGNAAAGGYGACTRDALGALLDAHIAGVPLDVAREESVHVVEYGALNSRSCALVPPVLAHFAEREAAAATGARSADPDEMLSFQVTHADKPSADFRCLSAFLDADPESYLRKSRAELNLDGRVFSTFAARPSGVKVLPKKSVSVGFSAMSLHWPSTDRKYRVAPATLAHGELMAFLSARASEFKPGGLLALAYIARSEEAALAASSPGTYSPSAGTPSSESPPTPANGSRRGSVAAGAGASEVSPPGTAAPAAPSPPAQEVLPRKKDIWAHLTSVLGKAIQRLVSTGLLKPQVARQLLALPLHPRTPRQTHACLRASAHSWDVLSTSVVAMAHPAWKGVEHGTVSAESWADQTIQLAKIFWEDEMRAVLRDALGSRGACEWVLDCLWTVAKEKVEEQPPHPLELEVQLVALRRRERPASVPSSPVDGSAQLPPGAAVVDVMQAVQEVQEEREGQGKGERMAPPVGAPAAS